MPQLTMLTSVGRPHCPLPLLATVVPLLLLLPSTTVVRASVDDGVCDLVCPSGATCRFARDVVAQELIPGSSAIAAIRGMMCSCPHGLTGVLCEVSYESCGDGSHACYHGGTCQQGAIDDFGNAQLYCNCQKAVESDGNTAYVGKYCQTKTVKALSATSCQENPSVFCQNGGICNANYPNYGDPCLCNNGHTGPRCEYTNGDNATTIQVDQTASITTTTDTSSSCPCKNGGSCHSQASANYANEYQFWENPDALQARNEYCVCPDNFDGPLCEIERTKCGDHHCFHGSNCTAKVDSLSGDTLHYCDCATASAMVAGRFCQYEATVTCKDANQNTNGNLFCVNQGTCRADVYEGCNCPSGYTGFSCEFLLQADATTTALVGSNTPLVDTAQVANCSLACINGGTCRHGSKQNSGGLDFFAQNTQHLSSEACTSDNLEHCVCPDGFAGSLCDQKVQDCAQGQYKCMHGGKCVPSDLQMLCDCDDSNSSLATFFYGNHCEHPVQEICTEGVSAETRVTAGSNVTFANLMPGTPLSFCVNRGKCKAHVKVGERHPGCYCPEGFIGPHCELRESKEIPGSHNIDPFKDLDSMGRHGRRSGLEKAVISIAVLTIVAVVAFTMYRRRRQKKRDAITSSLWHAKASYRDDEGANIAPKRGSVLSRGGYEDDEVYRHAISNGNTSSLGGARSNQPEDLSAAANDDELSADNEEDDMDNDDDVVIDLGKPKDEDGFELSNVEIV